MPAQLEEKRQIPQPPFNDPIDHMRIWDIDPGYLNRQSLLGEHRELHGIVSIIVNGTRGYSCHPETRRWAGHGWALQQRHRLLAAEMALRGYTDRSPVTMHPNYGIWPEIYIDEPFRQFQLLREKYAFKAPGRIPLPKNAQQLWSQHKYSVLARDPNLYREIGRNVATMEGDFPDLAKLLVRLLQTPPSTGGIRNALQHMWGYVAKDFPPDEVDLDAWPLHRLLREIQQKALATAEPYLTASTALSELSAWLPAGQQSLSVPPLSSP